MKKVLFATTALVLSAGVAAAEVSLSGNGRMGVVYNGAEWNFSSRARVVFTLSGQTDGGLEFGGEFRADNAAGAANGSAGEIYISGAFGKIAMGDVVGAVEAVLGDLPEIGFQDLDSIGVLGVGSNDIPYLTGDSSVWTGITAANNPVLLYTYSAGAFTVAASMSDGKLGAADDFQEMAVAAAYTFGDYTIGAGYEYFDMDALGSAKMASIGGVAQFGNTNVKAYFAKGGSNHIVDKAYGIGASSVFGATTVEGYVQKVETTFGTDVTWWGLGAEYDLGGGAAVKGGIADNDLAGTDVIADLGVTFTF